MSKIKGRLITCLISFALFVLMYSLLGTLGITSDINNSMVIKFFIICIVIGVVMFLTDKLAIGNRLFSTMIHLLDIVAVVLILGKQLHVFTITPKDVPTVLFIIIMVYLGVYGIQMIKNHSDANMINKKINLLQQESKKGGY